MPLCLSLWLRVSGGWCKTTASNPHMSIPHPASSAPARPDILGQRGVPDGGGAGGDFHRGGPGNVQGGEANWHWAKVVRAKEGNRTHWGGLGLMRGARTERNGGRAAADLRR